MPNCRAEKGGKADGGSRWLNQPENKLIRNWQFIVATSFFRCYMLRPLHSLKCRAINLKGPNCDARNKHLQNPELRFVCTQKKYVWDISDKIKFYEEYKTRQFRIMSLNAHIFRLVQYKQTDLSSCNYALCGRFPVRACKWSEYRISSFFTL